MKNQYVEQWTFVRCAKNTHTQANQNQSCLSYILSMKMIKSCIYRLNTSTESKRSVWEYLLKKNEIQTKSKSFVSLSVYLKHRVQLNAIISARWKEVLIGSDDDHWRREQVHMNESHYIKRINMRTKRKNVNTEQSRTPVTFLFLNSYR